ncbi:MAG: acetyl-CoA C-acyltransferase, partial [Gammaproteobacteria bacterium]|nr:acetyl-CoA C-acyltransferase [Gammaproteobacteria bacterium]
MTEAYIFDHVRTPRGKGKSDGSLHEVTPIELVTQVLKSLKNRNDLDTSRIDDVIMGVVGSQGEQASNPARVGAINAGYDEKAAGKQLNRFCASGLEAVNSAAAQIMSGMSDLCIGGGLESMSRVPMNSVGGALGVDPQVAYGN